MDPIIKLSEAIMSEDTENISAKVEKMGIILNSKEKELRTKAL
jgi:hypothetical protein